MKWKETREQERAKKAARRGKKRERREIKGFLRLLTLDPNQWANPDSMTRRRNEP